MKKLILIFGLIAGAILSATMAISMLFIETIKSDRAEVLGYTSMLAAFLLIFFGVKSYRDSVGGGTVSFGRAFAMGMGICAIASVLYVATWEAMYYGRPGFAEKVWDAMIEGQRKKGGAQAEIDARVAQYEKYREMYKNPVINAGITFVEPLPVGLIVSLVTAGVLRRRKTAQA